MTDDGLNRFAVVLRAVRVVHVYAETPMQAHLTAEAGIENGDYDSDQPPNWTVEEVFADD